MTVAALIKVIYKNKRWASWAVVQTDEQTNTLQ